MADRLPVLEPGDSPDADVNELLAEAQEEWYEDAAFFGAMAHQPTLFKRLVRTLAAFPQSDAIGLDLLELMRLRVARVHECAYCATVRTRAVRDEVATREAAVLADEIDADALTRREYLGVRLVDLLSADPHRITDEDFDELAAAFSEPELVELLLFASLEIGLDRFTIALNLDTTEESPYPTGLEYPLEDPLADPDEP